MQINVSKNVKNEECERIFFWDETNSAELDNNKQNGVANQNEEK